MHNDFLNQGAYPFYFEDKTKYIDRINETINTILHTDLSKLFSIQPDKIATLKKLLITICVSKPLEMSMDKLAERVGISKTTLYKYISYLADAELIACIMHQLHYVDQGDFLIDEKYTVEIGGKNKDFKQIKEIENAYVVADDIEIGYGNKLPLWLFGFLY